MLALLQYLSWNRVQRVCDVCVFNCTLFLFVDLPLESVALLHEVFNTFAYIYVHHGLYVLRCLITQKL